MPGPQGCWVKVMSLVRVGFKMVPIAVEYSSWVLCRSNQNLRKLATLSHRMDVPKAISGVMTLE